MPCNDAIEVNMNTELTVTQLRRLQRAYQKIRDMWIRSNDINKYEYITELNISIVEIIEQIEFRKQVFEDTEAA